MQTPIDMAPTMIASAVFVPDRFPAKDRMASFVDDHERQTEDDDPSTE
jgi:hypothetical protein